MKLIQKITKAFIVAFSIYSKIPMPRFNWESEDMQYHLCFFPWVGALIGGLEYLWYKTSEALGVGQMLFVLLAVAIPILVTGGFHLDGYMDTCDALHSYQDREKKLEILKDPHIGAFAVICLAGFMLLAIGFASEIKDEPLWLIGCINFALARAMSGIGVVTLQSAKSKGMLQTFSTTAAKKTVLTVLGLEAALCIIAMIWLQPVMGLTAVLGAALVYGYYVLMSKRQFGGITGDLAGFFVAVEELVVVMILGVGSLLF